MLKTNYLAPLAIVAGLAVAGPAQAQLLPNAPVRVQVGNGPSLIGPSTPSSAVGVSVLSSQGGTGKGTSIRVLGNDKTLGVFTRLIETNGHGTSVALVRTPLDSALKPITTAKP